MANSNAPFGLKWIGDVSSGIVSGKVRSYVIPSTDSANYFMGDPVKSTSTGTTDGIPTVAIASGAGDTLRGIIVGFKVNPDNLNITYGAASTTRTAFVLDSPFAEFLIQSNGTGAITDLGANANLATGSGSTVTGLSGYTLDESSVGTENTKTLRILELYNVVNNTLGAYNIYRVMINLHELKSTTGT